MDEDKAILYGFYIIVIILCFILRIISAKLCLFLIGLPIVMLIIWIGLSFTYVGLQDYKEKRNKWRD